MLCPRCASNQSDDIKFCTSCGANLQAVREALDQRESKFDWSDTWLAEMFMSGKAAELRKREIERRMGITPEVKRYREIKAGVIVSSIGLGVAIFLHVFMKGVILNAPDDAAEILSRVWIAGIIPFLIGLALIINGVVVSKKLVEISKRNEKEADELKGGPVPRELRPGDPSEFIPAGMSVTDQTTRHLKKVERKNQ